MAARSEERTGEFVEPLDGLFIGGMVLVGLEELLEFQSKVKVRSFRGSGGEPSLQSGSGDQPVSSCSEFRAPVAGDVHRCRRGGKLRSSNRSRAMHWRMQLCGTQSLMSGSAVKRHAASNRKA